MSDRTPADIADALAVRLEHRATQNGIVRSYGIMPSSRPEDDDMDREAAALLRRQREQLDTLRNAIGAVNNIRRVAAQLPDATSYSLASLALWMDAVADAVDALAAAGGGVPEEGA